EKEFFLPLYLTEDMVVAELKDDDSAYQFGLGRLFLHPFIPGMGDTRFGDFTELYRGYNLVNAEGVTNSFKQYRISIRPYSKVSRLNLSIWRTSYMTKTKKVLEFGAEAAATFATKAELQTASEAVNTRVQSLEGVSASYTLLTYNSAHVVPANAVVPFAHIVVEHNLNSPVVSVEVYDEQDDSQILPVKRNDQNSVYLDVSSLEQVSLLNVIVVGAFSTGPADS
ncbi:MAG: hypothetical protein ACRCZS_19325, partial [Chroococcidiopsis sp.]